MKRLDVYSARDLRNRAGGLIRDAEEGRLSLITKHGRPTAVAVPFDGLLIEQGIHRHMAALLFEEGLVTLAQGAKIAALPLDEFVDVLDAQGVDIVDHPPDEVEEDLKALP